MQGLTKKVQIEGLTVIVRELTFGEIQLWERELEDSIKQSNAGAADMLLMENFSVSDLVRMTDLTEEKIMEIPPSVLDEVYKACLEVNGRFFVLRQHLIQPLKIALEYMRLTETRAASSGPATRMSRAIRGLSTWLRLKKSTTQINNG
jgi:hypothetical protein